MNQTKTPAEVGCNEGLGGLSAAAHDVLAERRRQVEAEGWTPAHDDRHNNGSLALAAACYACNAATWAQRSAAIPKSEYSKFAAPGFRWPWSQKWWKPKDQRRDLVRAAALLLAEIERLDRLDRVQADTMFLSLPRPNSPLVAEGHHGIGATTGEQR